MKKLSAALLAAVMVAGLCLTSYADPLKEITPADYSSKASPRRVATVESAGYLANSDGVVVIDLNDGEGDRSVDKVAPGETVYYKLKTDSNLAVTTQEAVSGITISQNWEIGKDLIDRIEIVQKKFIDRYETDYCYMLAVTIKSAGLSASIQDIMGNVTLKKTSGTDSAAPSGANSYAFTMTLRFFFEIGYAEGDFSEIPKKPMVYLTGGVRDVIAFTFEDCDYCSLELDITGSDRILLGASSDYISAIENRYANADLTFFSGISSNFNKTAILKLHAPSGSYLYEIGSGNNLKVSNAQYDEYEDCFIIETKSLGKYVISNKSLNIAGESSGGEESGNSSSSTSSASEPNHDIVQSSVTEQPAPDYSSGKVNPGTGARA